MKRRIALPAVLAGVVLVAGCWSDYPGGAPDRAKQASGSKVAPSSESKTAQPASGPSTPPQAPVAGFPPSPPPSSPIPPTMPPGPASPGYPPPAKNPLRTTPAEAVAIDLSAGVALAQTGPEGVMMGFSVDYQFISGQPHPSAPYFWVIERSKGPAAKIRVNLNPKDNLSIMPVRGWRPEEGPFRTHIEDSSGRRISEDETLVSPGGF